MQSGRGDITINGVQTRSKKKQLQEKKEASDLNAKRYRDNDGYENDLGLSSKKMRLTESNTSTVLDHSANDNKTNITQSQVNIQPLRLFLELDEDSEEATQRQTPLTNPVIIATQIPKTSSELKIFDNNTQILATLKTEQLEIFQQQSRLDTHKDELEELSQQLNLREKKLQNDQDISNRIASDQSQLLNVLMNMEQQLNANKQDLLYKQINIEEQIKELQQVSMKHKERETELLTRKLEVDQVAELLDQKEQVLKQLSEKLSEITVEQLQEKADLEQIKAIQKKKSHDQDKLSIELFNKEQELLKIAKELDKKVAEHLHEKKQQENIATEQIQKRIELEKIAVIQKQTTQDQGDLSIEQFKKSQEQLKITIEQEVIAAEQLQNRKDLENIASIQKQRTQYQDTLSIEQNKKTQEQLELFKQQTQITAEQIQERKTLNVARMQNQSILEMAKQHQLEHQQQLQHQQQQQVGTTVTRQATPPFFQSPSMIRFYLNLPENNQVLTLRTQIPQIPQTNIPPTETVTNTKATTASPHNDNDNQNTVNFNFDDQSNLNDEIDNPENLWTPHYSDDEYDLQNDEFFRNYVL